MWNINVIAIGEHFFKFGVFLLYQQVQIVVDLWIGAIVKGYNETNVMK